MNTEEIKDGYYIGSSVEKPFWNAESRQFMFAPAFQFQPIPGSETYIYELRDENGGIHSFLADSACASLSPVWDEVPEGITSLEVFTLGSNGKRQYKIGARTFFRLAPFSSDLPPADGSYRECALKAFDYMYNGRIIRHWLRYGTPDPHYDLNVYPSKMVASVITSMLRYAELCPKRAAQSLKIAVNAANWLITVTEPEGAPLEGLPPTYYTAFRKKDKSMDDLSAAERSDTIMMFYPADVGSAYLLLEEKTGDKKYFDAAMRIAEYYRKNVQENGTWHLVVSRETGKPVTESYCMPTNAILDFLRAVYRRTKKQVWKKLSDNALSYVEKGPLATWHWEGQFEDSVLSLNYSNLAHGDCDKLIRYYAENYPKDKNRMRIAAELMKFVEDQFVVWKRPCPWDKCGFDTTSWATPCGLEQYNWYVPIDASTAGIALSFLSMFKATGDKLYLRKALALANTITRVQNKEDGRIPTEWKQPGFTEHVGKDQEFWINCLFYSACTLIELSDYSDSDT